jgi:hypothetical protein
MMTRMTREMKIILMTDDLDDVPENMETDAGSKGGENGPGRDKTPRNSTAGTSAGTRNVRTAGLDNHEAVVDNQSPEFISHLYESRDKVNVDGDSEQMLKWGQFLENR